MPSSTSLRSNRQLPVAPPHRAAGSEHSAGTRGRPAPQPWRRPRPSSSGWQSSRAVPCRAARSSSRSRTAISSLLFRSTQTCRRWRTRSGTPPRWSRSQPSGPARSATRRRATRGVPPAASPAPEQPRPIASGRFGARARWGPRVRTDRARSVSTSGCARSARSGNRPDRGRSRSASRPRAPCTAAAPARSPALRAAQASRPGRRR